MLASNAKAIARTWVIKEAGKIPGFQGAFFHGSINWLAEDALLSATSDLDIMLVFAEPPPVKPGKFVYQAVMLEVSYLAWADLPSAATILSTAHLAGSFQGNSVIADPTGRLTALQQVVATEYAKRAWVCKRLADTEAKIQRHLGSLNAADPFHAQVTSWLFGTGCTTHLLLVAGLRNPTVRRRYVAARALLHEYGHNDEYDALLRLLGCAALSRDRVQVHLDSLARAFDAAKVVIKTPFFFAADINEMARPVAIGGSHEMIDAGDHREAIFWIVATYARCLTVFAQDAPALVAEFMPGFERLVADLGIHGFADLVARRKAVEDFLPKLRQVVDAILAVNPAIEP